MGTITDDIDVAAKWIATALSSSGYKTDFTPSSLWEIDRFFDEHSRNGQALPGGLLSEQIGNRIFSLGSYVGEVLRQAKGGTWVGDDADPQAEINIELQLADGIKCWPVQRTMNRFKNGNEDSIAAFGHGFGIDVGHRSTEAKKKPWWRLGR